MAIDLTGKLFNVAQQKIDKGQNINLDFSVVNNGDESIQPFNFDIVISQDDVIDKNDLKLGNYEIKNGLGAGQDSGSKSFRYSTPDAENPFWLDEDASYTVGLRLDPQNKFAEADENNNSNQGLGVDFDTVEAISFGESDLVGLQTSVGKTEVAAGSYIDLSFSVANVSQEIANPFSVDVYLSKDNTVSEGDAKIGSYDIRDIVAAGGDTGEKTYSYQVPSAGHPFWKGGDGQYNVVLDIDSKDEVKETNNENNSGQNVGSDNAAVNFVDTGSVEPTDGADLAVTGFKVPAGAAVGETVTVEYKVTNNGNAVADSFATGFYLFTEDYLASNDSLDLAKVPEVYFLQGDRNSALTTLGAGESKTLTTELTIPEEWEGFSGPGDYFLGAEADAYDDVVESNETNNSITLSDVDFGKIGINNAPGGVDPATSADLLTGDNIAVTPNAISTGDAFEVTYEISNKGTANAEGFAAGFYLFSGEYLTGNDSLSLESVPEVYFLQGDRASSLIDLAAGKSTTLTTELTMPEDWDGFAGGSGEYYVGYSADPFGDVTEGDETNNSLNGLDKDYAKVNINVI